jgi:hypothetical protein
MTSKTLPFRLAIVLFILLALPGASVNAQEVDGVYLNGHNVTGEFLAFYTDVPDYLLIFGYPITEAFTDQPTGTLMQYFQRARMDIVDGEVTVAPLGDWLYDTTLPVTTIDTGGSFCEDFSTDYNVCYEFLLFYEQHNGEKYFGKPISDLHQVSPNAPSMQYFENVRMEFHPNAATGEKVSLSHLGHMHFNTHYDNPDMLRGTADITNAPATPVELKTHAFVQNVLAQPHTDQIIYVIVQDSQLQPVENATVYVTLRYPDGTLSSKTRLPIETDANGVSTQPFDVPAYDIDEIIHMDVDVEYNGSEAETTTWFRIWW